MPVRPRLRAPYFQSLNCGSPRIRKVGHSARGEPRYRCDNPDCAKKSFMLTCRHAAHQPGIKEKVVEMAVNSGGVRDYGPCPLHQ
ncbi:IS1/IS1595 family N-terminal zinc-binding domain-containing protein [Candidatus Thiothrix phosphatis]|uniref:IS1/IS1595 family N-terminal zinc-binding domain-containing protein n=1 Tax=Candidatus Thiothrix phosphatis TaxID=3112415 RepID=UPI0040557D9B